MPIKKSAIKDLRQSKKRALHNKRIKTNVKVLIKKSLKAIEKKDEAGAQELLAKAIKALDKAAQKKVIKKNTAARKKSRLMKRLNALRGTRNE